MARDITVMAVGDSITQGSISNDPGTGPGAAIDTDACWTGLLEDRVNAEPGWQWITNAGLGGTTTARWLPGSPDRVSANVATFPPRQPAGPPGDQPLWDWGIAPFMPIDCVILTPEVNQGVDDINQMNSSAGLTALTVLAFVEALLAAGANCVLMNTLGYPDMRSGLGLGAITPGTKMKPYNDMVADLLQSMHYWHPRVQRGYDHRSFGTFPPVGFYGDGSFNNDMDIHPDLFAQDFISDGTWVRLEQIPRYILQPDQLGS